MPHPLGERLFCRYASSPNELGYCGPTGAAGIAAVARGDDAEVDVAALAAGFSGAWVYQVLIGRMTGRDPLDAEVVRGYWTGNALTAGLDREDFFARLLKILGPRAGSYWTYLDESLGAEASPHHAFHVLGVYPWSRLLASGRPEPAEVLCSCCIRPGRVLAIDGQTLTVRSDEFFAERGRLRTRQVERSGVVNLFDPAVVVGDTVALHWGSACDLLTSTEADVLAAQLDEQLGRLNARLARENR